MSQKVNNCRKERKKKYRFTLKHNKTSREKEAVVSILISFHKWELFCVSSGRIIKWLMQCGQVSQVHNVDMICCANCTSFWTQHKSGWKWYIQISPDLKKLIQELEQKSKPFLSLLNLVFFTSYLLDRINSLVFFSPFLCLWQNTHTQVLENFHRKMELKGNLCSLWT